MDKIAHHYLVSGRVQGVYYRASTVKQAKALGITGWVRNLTDGRVEVFACGTAEQLSELQNWLWQGPPTAKVEAVDGKAAPWQDLIDFTIC